LKGRWEKVGRYEVDEIGRVGVVMCGSCLCFNLLEAGSVLNRLDEYMKNLRNKKIYFFSKNARF